MMSAKLKERKGCRHTQKGGGGGGRLRELSRDLYGVLEQSLPVQSLHF